MTRLLNISAAVVLLCFFVWPFGTLLRFYLALKSSDAAVVERMVDWPSVRKSINEDLNQTAEREINKKINRSENAAEFKVKLNFTSISIANTIAAKIASPEALIFLFNQPTKFHCFKDLRIMPEPVGPADCQPSKNELNSDDKKEFSLRGPNFLRIYEKTSYLFFTDLFTFKFEVLHDEIPVVLTLRLRTYSWLLTELDADWQKIIYSK